MNRTLVYMGALALGTATGLGSTAALSQGTRGTLPATTENETRAAAIDAYVYGYPLVTMETTRRVMTNTASAGDLHAPMGQFANVRSYPTPEVKDVTAPNADTLYSVAWLDLSKEPWVLTIPDMKDRYYLFEMLDGWTDVFQDPGKRTTGTGEQRYAVTGPGWKGKLPTGVTEYKSPTNIVWILGRIYSTGTPEDFQEVHALQDKLSLVPLSAYGKPYTPPPGQVDPNVDMKTPVRDQVNAMEANAYFTVMAQALKKNPPAAADAAMVQRMAKIGIVPGKDFDAKKLSPAAAKAIADAPKEAQEKIAGSFKEASVNENGWDIFKKVGTYGTDYLGRATIAMFGLGANRPKDAVYPTSTMSADGQPYDGSHKYVMHFDKGQEPPVNAFWSLTMYDDKFFFVANSMNRYTLSPRNNLKKNPDGSLDLYVQKDSPGGDKEANWLPAPDGKFVLMLRLYWPKESPPSILDGSWKPPPVKRAEKRD